MKRTLRFRGVRSDVGGVLAWDSLLVVRIKGAAAGVVVDGVIVVSVMSPVCPIEYARRPVFFRVRQGLFRPQYTGFSARWWSVKGPTCGIDKQIPSGALMYGGGICSKNRDRRWTLNIIYPHMCLHHVGFCLLLCFPPYLETCLRRVKVFFSSSFAFSHWPWCGWGSQSTVCV